MAVVSVSANNTRVEDSESGIGWTSIGGGPGGASEGAFPYQGNNLYNRRITSLRGFYYDPTLDGGSAQDLTSAATPCWMVKAIVTDYAGLDPTSGLRIRIGSGTADYHQFVISGTDAPINSLDEYTARGGLFIVPVDPNVIAYRDTTVGAPTLTATDYFGLEANFIVSAAKSENVGLDAIDLGTGLTLVGGDGASADGNYQNFVDQDEGNVTNRWGYASSVFGAIQTFFGTMTIGSSTATEFTDNEAQILWLDGLFASGFSGVSVDLQNAATSVLDGSIQTGLGSASIEDTRPDYTVTGTLGSFLFSGTLNNFRNISLTSACTLTGDVECADLTQSGATITNATIRCNAPSGIAVCNDVDFTKLTNTSIEQTGSGHAIEITTAGTYTLTDLTYSGFGSDETADAVIYNNSGGNVTLNVDGGGTPTVRNGTSATTQINNAVPITLNDLVPSSTIQIYDLTNGVELFKLIEPSSTFSDSINYTTDLSLRIRVRNASSQPYYKPFNAIGTLTSNGFNLSVNQELDQ